MIIAIWDWLFTRRVWKVVDKREVIRNADNTTVGYRYTMQDQFGNLKSFKDWY